MDILNDNDDTNMDDSNNNNNDNVDLSLNDNNDNDDVHMADSGNNNNNNGEEEGDGINHQRLRQLSNYADQNRDDDTWYWDVNTGDGFNPRPPTGWPMYRPLSSLSEVEREEIRVGETRMVSHMEPYRYEGYTGISLDWGEYYVADDEMSSSSSSSDEESTLSEAEEIREEEVKEEEQRLLSLGLANINAEQAPSAMDYEQLDKDVEASDPTLMGMPDIILEKILHYSSELTSDVCVLELVCKRIRRLTTGDDFWRRHPSSKHRSSVLVTSNTEYEDGECMSRLLTQCKEDISDLPFTRQMAFELEAIGKIRFGQSGGDSNIILDVLRDEGECVAGSFRTISASILSRMNQCGGHGVHFRLRGDTIGYLCELLQGYMVRILQNALLVAIHSINAAVKEDDIELAFRMQRDITITSSPSPSSISTSSGIEWKWPSDNCCGVLPPEAGRRIIRRLAYQAGILRMSNEAFISAEAELLHVLGVLLVSAYESSVRMAKTTQFLDEEKEVTYNEPTISVDMFNTPPPPYQDEQLVYTIVPGQISVVAEERGITPYNVYGAKWVAISGFTKVEEEEIERSYYYEDNGSSNEDDESEESCDEGKESRLEDASDSSDSEAEIEEGEEDSVMDMDDYETSVYWDSNRGDRHISMLG